MFSEFSKLPWTWTEEDLTALVASGRQENWHLEYKRSDLLTDKNRCIRELTKAVSAFNNGDGGVIVIGIKEAKKGNRRYADELDGGVPASEIDVTWLVQVIQSNIDPAIPDLRVSAVALSCERQERVALVICIPRGKRAVQASDLLYYQRIEDQSLPMRGFQIRDVNNRVDGPDLHLNLRFPAGRGGQLISTGKGTTEQVAFEIVVRNFSDIVAELAMFRIMVPQVLSTSKPNYWIESKLTPEIRLSYGGRERRAAASLFERYYRSPEAPPIFRGLGGFVIGTFGLMFRDNYEHVPHFEPVLLVAEGPRMEPRFEGLVLEIDGAGVTIVSAPDAEITLDGIEPLTYCKGL